MSKYNKGYYTGWNMPSEIPMNFFHDEEWHEGFLDGLESGLKSRKFHEEHEMRDR